MRKCVIHVGMHKTGSTSIQNSLYEGLDGEWNYCRIFNVANNGYFFKKLWNTKIKKDKKHHEKLLAIFIKDIQRSNQNYVLSAEGLSANDTTEKMLLYLKNLLLTYFQEIIIVGYVRPPKSYMESAFQERLKGDFSKLNFNSLCPQYRFKLEKFDKVFGKKNVYLYKFSPDNFVNHCVVQDFCQHAGIPFPIEKIQRSNEGLSLEATSLLYTYRKYTSVDEQKMIRRKSEVIAYLASQLKGQKLKFATEAVQPSLAKRSTNIRWMEKRLNQSLLEKDETSTNAIRSEADLLRYKPETLMWLAQQLGNDYVAQYRPDMTPEEVAAWMQKLYLKLDGDKAQESIKKVHSIANKTKTITLGQLTHQIKRNMPALSLNDKQIGLLISAVFKHINHELNRLGVIKIQGLGVFTVRSTSNENRVSNKRIIFKNSDE